MGLFRKIFKRKAQERSIKKIIKAQNVLKRRKSILELKMRMEHLEAVKSASNNKKVALQALRRKKQTEKKLQEVDNVLRLLEQQRDEFENAQIKKMTAEVLAKTAKTLKHVQKKNTRKMDKIIKNMNSQTETANEIAEAVSEPAKCVSFTTKNSDKEEIEKELDGLNISMGNLRLFDSPSTSSAMNKKQEEILDVD